MSTRFKKATITTALILALLMPYLNFTGLSTYASSLPSKQIDLYIDNVRLDLDVAPLLKSGRVLLPFRVILEAVGASVSWDSASQTAFAIKPPVTMALKPLSKDAFINGIPVALDTPVQFINGRLLVPARFVSERLGARVTWLEAQRQVRISLNSLDQSPPPNAVDSSSPQSPGYTTSTYSPLLGSQVADLVNKWGQPQEILQNQYGFYWYVYHDQYQNLELVGIRSGLVVARYTDDAITFNGKTAAPGLDPTTLAARLGPKVAYIDKGSNRYFYDEPNVDLYKLGTSYLRVFYDAVAGGKSRRFVWINAQEELNINGYYGQQTDVILRNHEFLMFILVNAARTKEGLPLLAWAPEVLDSARAHSADMAARGFFDHITPEGIAPYQRLEASGVSFVATAENLAGGQFDAIHAHEALMNSPGHRRNILSDMTRLGVGIARGGHFSIYYTCTFYIPQ